MKFRDFEKAMISAARSDDPR